MNSFWRMNEWMNSSCFILHPAVGLPTLPSCADPSKSIQMQDSVLLFWSHVQGTGGSFPSEGNLSNLIYVVSFSYTSRGRRDCCVQQLPKVMRIYSLQLTSSHKVLSWLYLFMVPSWCRFVRCIWSLFFFPPSLQLRMNSSFRWWKAAPLYFTFKFTFNI